LFRFGSLVGDLAATFAFPLTEDGRLRLIIGVKETRISAGRLGEDIRRVRRIGSQQPPTLWALVSRLIGPVFDISSIIV